MASPISSVTNSKQVDQIHERQHASQVAKKETQAPKQSTSARSQDKVTLSKNREAGQKSNKR